MANKSFLLNGSLVTLSRIRDFNSLVIGNTYYVTDGFWSGLMIYCGHVHDARRYTFTFGSSVDSWRNSFCLCGFKSNLEVYRYDA